MKLIRWLHGQFHKLAGHQCRTRMKIERIRSCGDTIRVCSCGEKFLWEVRSDLSFLRIHIGGPVSDDRIIRDTERDLL